MTAMTFVPTEQYIGGEIQPSEREGWSRGAKGNLGWAAAVSALSLFVA